MRAKWFFAPEGFQEAAAELCQSGVLLFYVVFLGGFFLGNNSKNPVNYL